MKRLLAVISCVLMIQVCFGQTPTPFRQFYFNPYLFNPAYTGINGYTELYLVYRKQWANFKDAPTTMGASFQYPTQKRVALGASVVSDDNVGIRNTSFTATFAYVVPIAESQTIRFGISGAMGSNYLHLKEGEYDPTDPKILSAQQNSFYTDGNFGAVYTNHGLRLGFALTRLFDPNSFSKTTFSEIKFSPLDNRLYSVSYRFPISGGTMAIEPYFLYRQSTDKLDAWEAATTIYFKEILWGGASYHQTQGLAFFLGTNVKNLLRFSYSYELPPPAKNFIAASSHELHIALRLGKKREAQQPLITKTKKNVPQIDSAALARKDEPKNEDPANDQPSDLRTADPSVTTKVVPVKNVAQNDAPPNNNQQTTSTSADHQQNNDLPSNNDASQNTMSPDSAANVVKPVVKPAVKKPSAPAKSFSLAAGHYVVAGAFKIMDNAIHYSQGLHRKGYKGATIAINPKNNLYYVYIFSTYDIDEARKIRNQYRLRRPFNEVWLFTME